MLINSFIPHYVINYSLIQNIQHINLNFEQYNINNTDFTYFLQNNSILYYFDLNEIKSIKIIKQHTSTVKDLLLLKDGRLASALMIKQLKYKKNDLTIQTGDCLNSIIQLDDDKIISCYYESMKIWKINNNNYECLSTLKGHSSWINKMIILPSHHIASCCHDKTIKIWKSNSPYQCIQTLTFS